MNARLLAAALDRACSQPDWWHDSGNLKSAVLRAIANHAAGIRVKETAETGCGLSTVLLSTVAERHTCLTIGAGSSLERVQNAPYLLRDRVNFVRPVSGHRPPPQFHSAAGFRTHRRAAVRTSRILFFLSTGPEGWASRCGRHPDHPADVRCSTRRQNVDTHRGRPDHGILSTQRGAAVRSLRGRMVATAIQPSGSASIIEVC
jgi:hypothetical protein